MLTNDEITAVPNYADGVGGVLYPSLALGEGSLTLGDKSVRYSIGCAGRFVNGTLPWKAIHTVVLPCADTPCKC